MRLSIAHFTMAELHRLRGSRAKRRLNGKADLRHNGAIAVSELDAYVDERVRIWRTATAPNQAPAHSMHDFAFAVGHRS